MMHKKLLIGFAAATTLLTAGTASASSLTGKLIAGGSTALQPLAQAASTPFMAKNPGVQVTVQGGGSGVGLTQVAAGTFQIGNSDIFAEEKSGIPADKLVDHKVAVVAFAAIVNKASVPVKNLTTQQLADIFTGKITNWKEVGGKNQKITLIERTAGSGTRVNFDNFALNKATEASGAITQDASGAVVTQVGQTPGAISYVALSYTSTSSKIKALKLNGVKPSEANVKSNAYKVWSYEHMYTLKGKNNKAANAYIKAVKSDTKDLKKLGYLPIGGMKVDRTADGSVKKK